ncbi:MAG TPA: hypothetical protein VNO51_15600 [Ilumatobacteraceae bacterium]|nr:hypothetical protein [Ilumatobacteraceae bacterium]
MTDIWYDSETDYLGSDDGAEWYDDGDAEYVDFGDDVMFDDATTRTSKRHRDEAARRQAIARRQVAARQRQALARRPRTPARPVTTNTAIRNTRAAVRHVDLENRVRADSLGGAVRSLDRRTTGTERTASANALVGLLQAEVANIGLDDDIVKLVQQVLPFGALLFLRPSSQGYMRDPRFLAGGIGIAALVAGSLIRKFNEDDDDGGVGVTAPRPSPPSANK